MQAFKICFLPSYWCPIGQCKSNHKAKSERWQGGSQDIDMGMGGREQFGVSSVVSGHPKAVGDLLVIMPTCK